MRNIVTRKIGHPYDSEYAIAALSENGMIVANKEELERINHEWFEREVKIQQDEIQRRRKLYLHNRNPFPIKGKIAIVVDDGLATGLTMEAAIRDIKHRHPKKIIVAVPVAPLDIAKKLEREVDACVILETPEYFVGGIGGYYKNFPQISDQEVIHLLREAEQKLNPGFL